MVDELISGHVTSFRREQGFGVITTDDGRDVKFDASACTMVPEEGAPVRLRVGPARWGGGVKALHVEPPASAVLRAATAPALLAKHLAALHRGQIDSVPSEAALQLADDDET
jgi:cold shock CspA family protein